jgi:hypothetical protein
MRRCFILAVISLLARAASAAPPPNADPALAPWFNDLRQPWTNALCCSIADCRPTESRTEGDHYEAFVGGAWRVVPDDKVLQRTDNPTGHGCRTSPRCARVWAIPAASTSGACRP